MSVRITKAGTRGSGFDRLPRWFRPIFGAMNITVFRLMGKRAKVQGRPLLLLETVGGKSGRRRQSTLGWFPDEDPARRAWLIVASNGGATTHPGWYFNLARRPDDITILTAGERVRVRAESLRGEERARAWRRVVALAPGDGKYETATDREIPIVRLVPR